MLILLHDRKEPTKAALPPSCLSRRLVLGLQETIVNVGRGGGAYSERFHSEMLACLGLNSLWVHRRSSHPMRAAGHVTSGLRGP